MFSLNTCVTDFPNWGDTNLQASDPTVKAKSLENLIGKIESAKLDASP